MFTPRLRLILAVVAFALGAYQIVSGHLLGLALLAASALLAYGYFKYGTVWLAFRAVARGDMTRAAELLDQVRRPDKLRAEERAYFELASGFVCASRAQNDQAEQHLRRARDLPLRTTNDRAMAEAVLAQLLVLRGEKGEARELLEGASARPCRPAVLARIRALLDEIAGPPAA